MPPPLGIILPMTIFFGSVGPDDFAKNYAAWARKWGLTDWADWLSLYATGPHVFWGVILVSFIYLVLAFGLPFLIENTKRTTAAVVVPITVAIIIAIAVYGQHEISLIISSRAHWRVLPFSTNHFPSEGPVKGTPLHTE